VARADPRLVELSPTRVVGDAPAKLNLFLEILARRPDGYHELVSVFQEIDLADRIEVEISPGPGQDRLELSGRPVDGPPEDNLVLRAIAAVRASGCPVPRLRVRLTKRIPAGGGLGGGSTDAAFLLVALQHLGIAPSNGRQIAGIARSLGSDVPFFLTGGAALCRGRGERVEPLEGLPECWFVLACPSFSLSTAKVYGRVRLTQKPREVIPFLSSLREGTGNGDVVCFNRLESAAFELRPELLELKNELSCHSQSRWYLTGSGSVLFCPRRRRQDAEEILKTVERLPDRGDVEFLLAGSSPRPGRDR
jgi:4-diphosphocytidyl-2-C-methyl-D-erythritol kinase